MAAPMMSSVSGSRSVMKRRSPGCRSRHHRFVLRRPFLFRCHLCFICVFCAAELFHPSLAPDLTALAHRKHRWLTDDTEKNKRMKAEFTAGGLFYTGGLVFYANHNRIRYGDGVWYLEAKPTQTWRMAHAPTAYVQDRPIEETIILRVLRGLYPAPIFTWWHAYASLKR